MDLDVGGDTTNIIVNPDTGAVTIKTDDGGAIVDTDPSEKRDRSSVKDHDANLALFMDTADMSSLARQLIDDIEDDKQSREEWMNTRTKGLALLGLQLEPPKGDVGMSAAPLDGMSSVRHPLLVEAVIRGASTASGELLPTDGPVKVRNDGPVTSDSDNLADALEKDMNHYLTTTASEYYPDTDRMLLQVYFGGTEFKKVYNCPLRRRPVSDWVPSKDLIVPSTAQNLRNAARITHQTMMRKSTLKRMQILDVYRDTPLNTQPVEDPSSVDRKEKQISGQSPQPDKPDQNRYTIYECYCELLPDEDVGVPEPDAPKGLALPYKVSIEKDSMAILEVRRNWKEGDDQFEAIQHFVKFTFVPGFGFYDIGLVNMLGNATQALTAAWRIALDSGMFANFPGFLYSKSASRQLTNEFRIPPGGGMAIDTGGMPINQAVMNLPYHDMTPGMLNMITHIEEIGQRVGGVADIQIGEGKPDVPVGTTIATIEQATKVLDQVHKRLHRAQAEELQLLKQCFKQNPEAFWRNNKKPSMEWTAQNFMAALEDNDLVPMADPNASSHIHRLMKVMALIQLASATGGNGWNLEKIQRQAVKTIGFDNPDEFIAPMQEPQPQQDPKSMADLAKAHMTMQAQEQDNQQQLKQDQLRAKEAALESQDRQADRQSRERIETMKLQAERLKLQQNQNQQAHQQNVDMQKTATDRMKIHHDLLGKIAVPLLTPKPPKPAGAKK